MQTSPNNNLKKFNLLFLEEGEHYIQDFFGKARYFDINSNSYRTGEAVIHFCSRSVILEFPKDSKQPLYKYLLKFFKKEPYFNNNLTVSDKGALPMIIYAQRLVEVPINATVTKPYFIHNAKDT